MKFNIRGDKLTVTEPIREYIYDKIGRLEKYLENSENLTANVLIKVRGINQIVEVTIPLKKIMLRAEESHKDLYAAIDLVSEKLERQIRKNKTKMKKINKEVLKELQTNYENDEDTNDYKVIRRKEIEMKPMSEEEAILQMNLLDHDFFIYKDAETSSVCVLYKRKDNNYGVIKTN